MDTPSYRYAMATPPAQIARVCAITIGVVVVGALASRGHDVEATAPFINSSGPLRCCESPGRPDDGRFQDRNKG